METTFSQDSLESASRKRSPEAGMTLLVHAIQKLSLARSLDAVVEIVRHAARELTGADGASFVLRDAGQCYYVDEDAIAPLWKGQRFPLEACVSGWTMIHKEAAVIPDIFNDARVPVNAYEPTFVRALAMVPIRVEQPIGAIGNYWARPYEASADEIRLLQALADSTSIALENIGLYANLNDALAEMRDARDELTRQLNLRDEFISISAHELRTPLTPLMIHTQFMQRILREGKFRGHPLEPDLNVFTATMLRKTGDFAKLIENLLDVSRIQLGRFTFNSGDELSLMEIVDGVVSEYRMAAKVPIEVYVESGIKGHWDRFRLEQAIGNLISNAVKYGGGKTIRISAMVLGERLRISVQDQGIGVAAADHTRIFDRFERAISVREYGGMGLGLYITRKIVDGFGGKIWVESEKDKGATFVIELPIGTKSS